MANLGYLFKLFASFSLGISDPGTAEDSQLDLDYNGFKDLITDPLLTGWTRSAFDSDEPVAATNPWHFNPDKRLLTFTGTPTGEMLRLDEPPSDYILHVDWRLDQTDPEASDGGVFVRMGERGQAIAPFDRDAFGCLFTEVRREGEPIRQSLRTKETVNRLKPTGEWNEFEIRAEDKTVALWVNGKTTSTWTECPIRFGPLALVCGRVPIMFRRVKLKTLVSLS